MSTRPNRPGSSPKFRVSYLSDRAISKWTSIDTAHLLSGVEKYGIHNWCDIQSDPEFMLRRFEPHQLRSVWESLGDALPTATSRLPRSPQSRSGSDHLHENFPQPSLKTFHNHSNGPELNSSSLISHILSPVFDISTTSSAFIKAEPSSPTYSMLSNPFSFVQAPNFPSNARVYGQARSSNSQNTTNEIVQVKSEPISSPVFESTRLPECRQETDFEEGSTVFFETHVEAESPTLSLTSPNPVLQNNTSPVSRLLQGAMSRRMEEMVPFPEMDGPESGYDETVEESLEAELELLATVNPSSLALSPPSELNIGSEDDRQTPPQAGQTNHECIVSPNPDATTGVESASDSSYSIKRELLSEEEDSAENPHILSLIGPEVKHESTSEPEFEATVETEDEECSDTEPNQEVDPSLSVISPVLLATPLESRPLEYISELETPLKRFKFAFVDGSSFPPPPNQKLLVANNTPSSSKSQFSLSQGVVSQKVKTSQKQSPSRPSKTVVKTRYRKSWTSYECKELVRLVAQYGVGNWAKIRANAGASISSRRSATDLKDKWRSLHNKSADDIDISSRPKKIWTAEETDCVRRGVNQFGAGSWIQIAQDPVLRARTPMQIKDRWRTITHQVSRGVRNSVPWTEDELSALRSERDRFPFASWAQIGEHPALQNRTPLQVKDKWRNLNHSATGKLYLILDSNHLPYHTLSGQVRIYRNNIPSLAASKALTKSYLYPGGEQDNPSKKVVVRILLLSDAQSTKSLAKVYSGWREIRGTSTNPNFEPKWTAKSKFVGFEKLKAPIQVDSKRYASFTSTVASSGFDSEDEFVSDVSDSVDSYSSLSDDS